MTIEQAYANYFRNKMEEAIRQATLRHRVVRPLVEIARDAGDKFIKSVPKQAMKLLSMAPPALVSVAAYSLGFFATTAVALGGICLSEEADKIQNLNSWINRQNDISNFADKLSEHMMKVRGEGLGTEQERDSSILNYLVFKYTELMNLQSLSNAEKQAHIDVQIIISLMECQPKPDNLNTIEDLSNNLICKFDELRHAEAVEEERQKAEDEEKKRVEEEKTKKAEDEKQRVEAEKQKAEGEKQRILAEKQKAEEQLKRAEAEMQKQKVDEKPNVGSVESTVKTLLFGLASFFNPNANYNEPVVFNMGLETEEQILTKAPEQKSTLAQ